MLTAMIMISMHCTPSYAGHYSQIAKRLSYHLSAQKLSRFQTNFSNAYRNDHEHSYHKDYRYHSEHSLPPILLYPGPVVLFISLQQDSHDRKLNELYSKITNLEARIEEAFKKFHITLNRYSSESSKDNSIPRQTFTSVLFTLEMMKKDIKGLIAQQDELLQIQDILQAYKSTLCAQIKQLRSNATEYNEQLSIKARSYHAYLNRYTDLLDKTSGCEHKINDMLDQLHKLEKSIDLIMNSDN